MFDYEAILILSTWFYINKMSFTNLSDMQAYSNTS